MSNIGNSIALIKSHLTGPSRALHPDVRRELLAACRGYDEDTRNEEVRKVALAVYHRILPQQLDADTLVNLIYEDFPAIPRACANQVAVEYCTTRGHVSPNPKSSRRRRVAGRLTARSR